MTRDEMKAKLAAVIRACRDTCLTPDEIAAEVLDLCWPRPLVWGDFTPHSRQGRYFMHSPSGYDITHAGELFFVEFKGEYLGKDRGQRPTLEAAQAAAKDHYEAAHWANTKMGDL